MIKKTWAIKPSPEYPRSQVREVRKLDSDCIFSRCCEFNSPATVKRNPTPSNDAEPLFQKSMAWNQFLQILDYKSSSGFCYRLWQKILWARADGDWAFLQRGARLRHLLAFAQGANYLHQWSHLRRHCSRRCCSAPLPRVGESIQAHSHVSQFSWRRRHRRYLLHFPDLLFYYYIIIKKF